MYSLCLIPEPDFIEGIAILEWDVIFPEPPSECFGNSSFFQEDCSEFLYRYSVNCFHGILFLFIRSFKFVFSEFGEIVTY